MNKFSMILATIICCFSIVFAQSGAVRISPSHVTQEEMNQDVLRLYNDFKDRHLRGTPSGNRFICAIYNMNDPTATSSQAHGYGMVIFAQMAKHDPNARKIFDGMNQLRKAHSSMMTQDLMAWVVHYKYVNNTDSEEIPTSISASRAGRSYSEIRSDLDMAYALLLAYRQWSDSTYKSEAIAIINALKESGIDPISKRLVANDLPSSITGSRTRAPAWVPGHFRAFATITGDSIWLEAADTVYSLLSEISHSETGLMPGRIRGIPATFDGFGCPGDPRCLERTRFDQNYTEISGVVPWRLALDYAFYATPAAKYRINKISRWLKEITNGDPNNIHSGYYLNGEIFPTQYQELREFSDIIFVAPFASGMIADPDNQEFLNRTYDIIRNPSEDYDSYRSAIQLLNMLLITGNWIDPVAESQIPSSIRRRGNTNRHGILLENAIVSEMAKITIITPEPATANITILDNLGNTIFTETAVGATAPGRPQQTPIIWNLTNPAGRFVANGTYLIIAEATGISGKTYRYSAKLGVKR